MLKNKDGNFAANSIFDVAWCELAFENLINAYIFDYIITLVYVLFKSFM